MGRWNELSRRQSSFRMFGVSLEARAVDGRDRKHHGHQCYDMGSARRASFEIEVQHRLGWRVPCAYFVEVAMQTVEPRWMRFLACATVDPLQTRASP